MSSNLSLRAAKRARRPRSSNNGHRKATRAHFLLLMLLSLSGRISNSLVRAMPTIGFDNRAVDVTGCKTRKLRLGDWYCEPPTWAKAMEWLAQALLDSVCHREQLLKNIRAIHGISSVSVGMRKPVRLDKNLWLEANKSAKDCWRTMESLLTAAGISLDQASVEYAEAPHEEKQPTGQQKEKDASSLINGKHEERVPGIIISAHSQPDFKLEVFAKPDSNLAFEKIGAYAKREIYSALADGRVPDDDFAKLLTLEGTKELLGVTLNTCPLYGLTQIIDKHGRNRCWRDKPALRNGKPVYVNSQWFEEYRTKLDKLLARWHSNGNTVTPTIKESSMDSMNSKLAELLEAEFANGIRPQNFIDQRKFRKLFRQWFDEELPDDFDFATTLSPLGIEHDGKVFPRLSAKGKWRAVIDGLLDRGHGILSFKVVMEHEASALMRAGIRSAEILRRTMLETCADAYEIGDTFFAAKGQTVKLSEAIASAFAEESVLSIGALASMFPFVDEADIRNAIKANHDFVWNHGDTYVRLSRIMFDEEEVKTAVHHCRAAVERDGFFSLAQLDLPESAAFNPSEFEVQALRRVFFSKFLSKEFDLKGQLVSVKGERLDAQTPLRAYLRERSEISLEEVFALAKEYGIAPYLAIETAHEEMTRTDENRFVSSRAIEFDVEATDDAIAEVCENGLAAFGAFDNFAFFPTVPGYAWNRFLLEGFLRRNSQRFALLSQAVASKGASGAVVKKGTGAIDAINAYARLAAAAGIMPDADDVADFLVASRCTLRRGRELVAAVVARMRQQTLKGEQ